MVEDSPFFLYFIHSSHFSYQVTKVQYTKLDLFLIINPRNLFV